jgi:hypothetical protein
MTMIRTMVAVGDMALLLLLHSRYSHPPQVVNPFVRFR